MLHTKNKPKGYNERILYHIICAASLGGVDSITCIFDDDDWELSGPPVLLSFTFFFLLKSVSSLVTHKYLIPMI